MALFTRENASLGNIFGKIDQNFIHIDWREIEKWITEESAWRAWTPSISTRIFTLLPLINLQTKPRTCTLCAMYCKMCYSASAAAAAAVSLLLGSVDKKLTQVSFPLCFSLPLPHFFALPRCSMYFLAWYGNLVCLTKAKTFSLFQFVSYYLFSRIFFSLD